MIKRILFGIFIAFFASVSHAQTETINWYNEDGTLYTTTTCESGGDIVLPTAPTKFGYTFTGWQPYTPIEYLRNTGTQWINTNYIPNQNTRIKAKVKFNTNSNNEGSVFGSGVSYSSQTFELYLWNRQIEFNYNNDYTQSSQLIQNGDILIIDWNKNIINYSINGITQPEIVRPYGQFSSPYPMGLFCNIRSQNPTPNMTGKIEIYYFQIYDDDVLVRDFIPVLDTGNNIPCLYDNVTNQFFYNAGTGDFVAGPVINE